jgi:hypothetical protein
MYIPGFEENETARTQEFVLRWSQDGGNTLKEIVRQQCNFSPPGAVREVEEYQVGLSNVSNVTLQELVIKPNIGGTDARVAEEPSLVLTVVRRSLTIRPRNSL